MPRFTLCSFFIIQSLITWSVPFGVASPMWSTSDQYLHNANEEAIGPVALEEINDPSSFCHYTWDEQTGVGHFAGDYSVYPLTLIEPPKDHNFMRLKVTNHCEVAKRHTAVVREQLENFAQYSTLRGTGHSPDLNLKVSSVQIPPTSGGESVFAIRLAASRRGNYEPPVELSNKLHSIFSRVLLVHAFYLYRYNSDMDSSSITQLHTDLTSWLSRECSKPEAGLPVFGVVKQHVERGGSGTPLRAREFAPMQQLILKTSYHAGESTYTKCACIIVGSYHKWIDPTGFSEDNFWKTMEDLKEINRVSKNDKLWRFIDVYGQL